MKTLITLLFATFSLLCFSQTELPIKFKVNEEADVWIGRAWDFSYTPLKYPINVSFDGKILNMVYDDGKSFWNIDIISYERKEKKL